MYESIPASFVPPLVGTTSSAPTLSFEHFAVRLLDLLCHANDASALLLVALAALGIVAFTLWILLSTVHALTGKNRDKR